jgi:hypothetical protein
MRQDKMTRETRTSYPSYPIESEFGKVLGGGLGGSVIKLDCSTSTHDLGEIVFIGGAFNLLTARELRRIARFMDTVK